MKWKAFFIIFKGLLVTKNFLKAASAPLKTIKTKIWEKWSQTKIWLDLIENLHFSQFESAESESVFEDFISKIKFRQFDTKTKLSSDLLEHVYTSQFEGAEYKSHIDDLSLHYTIHLIEIN